MELTNKVFFITGAAQGLGKAYVEAVLEKGAKVFFGDVNEALGNQTRDDIAGKYGPDKVKFKAFDVTDTASFEGAFKEAVSEYGQVDVLVNNAGVMNEGIWEKMIQINVKAVIHGTKLATEHMRKDKGGKGGRIINISSIAGLVDIFALSVYSATKHAVRAYTSSLALQPNIADQGVEYGILCPHAAATDLVFKLDDTKIDFADKIIAPLEKMAMPVETVVEGFMELLQLNKMNGAIRLVEPTKKTFRKMEHVEVQSPDAPKEESA